MNMPYNKILNHFKKIIEAILLIIIFDIIFEDYKIL